MGYVKIVKSKQYFKKFKVKFRRRRECKTNYRLRRRLITQDKRKYNTPKWRFVVRITNKDVICQVVAAKTIGDQILCAAYSHELKRYGLKVGLTNYAACYATGLLCARRLLKKLNLDKIYKGKRDINGKMFRSRVQNAKFADGRIYRPFKCILDVGLRRASKGARIFGAMKGAVDGGLDIPHSNKRFPGFKKSAEADTKDAYDPEAHWKLIFGQHVAEYMTKLQENDPDKYAKQFKSFVTEGLGPDDLEDLYDKVHTKIRQDPGPWPQAKRDWTKMEVRARPGKMPLEERRRLRAEKIQEFRAKAGAEPMQQDKEATPSEDGGDQSD
jgi:large subunit ribosomal protein L5e